MLAQDRYLGLPAETILTSLPGAVARRTASGRGDADVSVFFANAATFPWRSQAEWFLRQLNRWGYLGETARHRAAASIFRPDLYAQAAGSLGLSVPTEAVKSEGRHSDAWVTSASPTPIEMGPDRFIDGAVFRSDSDAPDGNFEDLPKSFAAHKIRSLLPENWASILMNIVLVQPLISCQIFFGMTFASVAGCSKLRPLRAVHRLELDGSKGGAVRSRGGSLPPFVTVGQGRSTANDRAC